MRRLKLDDITAALWHFDEAETSHPPSDAAGNVTPLAPVTAGQVPAVVAGHVDNYVTGARQFASGFAFKGTQAVADSTRLTRSMTLEAVLKYTQNGTRQTIAVHGKATGAGAEDRPWWISLRRTGGLDKVSFLWQRQSTGLNAVVGEITFTPPAGWFYLAVVREWISTTSATIRAYIGQVVAGRAAFSLVGTATSTEADVDTGGDGEINVGCNWNQTGGVYESFTANPIAQIRVSSEVRSAEEIEHTFRELFETPTHGYELLRQLQPPGLARPQSPSSKFQQLFQVAGGALGTAWSKTTEMLDDFLPDRAWSFLDRWETITRLAPTPGDSIETRRARVVGFLRRVQGYTRAQIVEAVADILDADTTDLAFVELSNIFLEEFDATLSARWEDITVDGSASAGGGILGLEVAPGDNVPWNASGQTPAAVRTTLPDQDGAQISMVLSGLSLGENGAAVGLYVSNFPSGNAHMFGIKRSAGANKWWHATLVAGVFTETLGANIPAGTKYWLRYRDLGGGLVDLEYQVDGTTFDGPWTTIFDNVASIAAARDWTGAFMSDSVDPVVTGSATDVEAFRIYTPNSRHVFFWYIYRDPALGGSPDVDGAQLVVSKMQPAHQAGFVITALSALCDSANSLLDQTPMGA